MFLCALAERLHKTLAEIMRMSIVELRTWEAYLRIQEERRG